MPLDIDVIAQFKGVADKSRNILATELLGINDGVPCDSHVLKGIHAIDGCQHI